MKKLIVNKMGIEARTLWELSKKSRLNGPFSQLLRDQVHSIKEEFISEKEDFLKTRSKKFKKSGSWAKHTLGMLPNMVYDVNKKPWEAYKGQWVSVELEVIMRSKEIENRFVAFIKTKGWSRYVTIKDDGSLRVGKESQCRCGTENRRDHRPECGANSYGKEIVVTFRYDKWDMITDLCGFLNRNRCSVNSSCGLHVHFDCRHLTADEVVIAGNKVANAIIALKTMLPRSRQDNQYCAEPINNMPNGRSLASSGGDRNSRYAFVNLHAYERHKTIEFRGHSGTADATKIINWIRIMRILMDATQVPESNTIQDLFSNIEFPDDLQAYMLERVAKFNGVRADRSIDDVFEDDSNTRPTQETVEQQASSVEDTLRRLSDMFTMANGIRNSDSTNNIGTLSNGVRVELGNAMRSIDLININPNDIDYAMPIGYSISGTLSEEESA